MVSKVRFPCTFERELLQFLEDNNLERLEDDLPKLVANRYFLLLEWINGRVVYMRKWEVELPLMDNLRRNNFDFLDVNG